MDSFVSATEDNTESISHKINDLLLLSTSPDVFKDFFSIIDQGESSDEDENMHLKYKIVLKDVIIKHLENN